MTIASEPKHEPKTNKIEIVISMIVHERDNYQDAISNISHCVMEQFPELKTDSKNNPLIRIKVR